MRNGIALIDKSTRVSKLSDVQSATARGMAREENVRYREIRAREK